MLKYTVAQKGIKGEKGTSPGSALDFKPTWTYNTIFPNHQAFQSMTSITSVGPSPSSTRTGSNDWSSTGTTVSPGVNTPLVNWYWDMINDFDALCKQLHEYNLFEQSNAFSDCIVYAVFYENHCPRPEHKATADEEDMINNYFNAMYPQMKKKVKIYMSTAMFLECYRVLGRKSFTQRLIEEYFVTGMPLHYIVAQLMESHRAQVAAASSKHAILYKPQNQNFLREFNIENGTDVRTTVMIRNIPNRLTVMEFKNILDMFVFGLYDFLYLRIDFSNGCNVGYAFVNFIKPDDILLLCNGIRGKQWTNSEKYAEISYATMQGRESLVQKFRNSSVMASSPTSRPKLFYTLPHPFAGYEEMFPGPDNLLKLTRSTQNAAHIGLYSNNRSFERSLEGRHRPGHYDRGTTCAELERIIQDKLHISCDRDYYGRN